MNAHTIFAAGRPRRFEKSGVTPAAWSRRGFSLRTLGGHGDPQRQDPTVTAASGMEVRCDAHASAPVAGFTQGPATAGSDGPTGQAGSTPARATFSHTLRTAAGSESHSGIHVPIAASQSAAPGCGAEILCGSGVADRPSPGQVRGWREVVARLADSTACDAESFAGIKHNPARVGLGSARDSMTEAELVEGYARTVARECVA